ncbi:MAG: adenosylcobinamide-GDP ribazoletransferase [Streptosporangiales bacterium]|nr:adenosylcobinamide-GDP ribazoletransferase [Streptosporangiales bacterium]
MSPRFSGPRNALSLFTVIPAGTSGTLEPRDAVRAVAWMPGVGVALGVLGGLVVAGTGGGSGARRLLGAVLALALVALLTGALHLDGLADTADGLGSRRPADAALDIMRKSDIGPMGVAALVLVLLIQVTALAAVPSPLTAALAFTLAQATSRVAVVLATGSPAARPGGFGALIAGRTSAFSRGLSVALLAGAVLAVGFGLGGAGLAVRGLAAATAGLLAGTGMRLIAVRRLGGTTGDVFGSVVEVTATAVLLACALAG